MWGRLGPLGRGATVALVVAVVAAAIWVWLYGPWPLATPSAGVAAQLDSRLTTQGSFVRFAPGAAVQSFVLRLPAAPGDKGSLLIGRQPGAGLARFGEMVRPVDSLAEPGLYLSVSHRDDKLAYVVRVTDPRLVRHESFERDPPEVGVHSASGGVIAARAPFVPRGTLHLFEVQPRVAGSGPPGEVTRVLLELPLRAQPFVKRGRRYQVPYS